MKKLVTLAIVALVLGSTVAMTSCESKEEKAKAAVGAMMRGAVEE